MTTTTTTTTFRTFIREPFDLALGQPHQMLISSASVAIVAVEAAALVPWPFNILLAIGAEWAYLRGLISGAGVKTPWSARLNWSAVLLVVLYGSLASLRGFGQIPAHPDLWLAVLLTIIHIGSISAVTLCSAMLHRAGAETTAAAQRARDEAAREREAQLQRDQDEIDLAIKREQARIELQKQRTIAEAEARQIARAARLSQTVSRTVSHPVTAPNKDDLRAAVVTAYVTLGDSLNVSQEAQRLGISRGMWYKLRDEARAAGELAVE